MTPKGHAIPSKTQLLSYGTPAFAGGFLLSKESAPDFLMREERTMEKSCWRSFRFRRLESDAFDSFKPSAANGYFSLTTVTPFSPSP